MTSGQVAHAMIAFFGACIVVAGYGAFLAYRKPEKLAMLIGDERFVKWVRRGRQYPGAITKAFNIMAVIGLATPAFVAVATVFETTGLTSLIGNFAHLIALLVAFAAIYFGLKKAEAKLIHAYVLEYPEYG
jgi:membrane associated rhomboid family serine protease